MKKEIEEMARVLCDKCLDDGNPCDGAKHICITTRNTATTLYNAGYRKVNDDEVVLNQEEYEKRKSLYEESQGAYMTSSIGDLPLTIEGLRRAVDEITRLNKVQVELQELNMRYYNEAKQLRKDSKEKAREILQKISEKPCKSRGLVCDFKWFKKICEEYGVEVE